MKFVSKHANHSISIDGGTSKAVVHPSGVTEFISNGDVYEANFKPSILTLAEIDAAKEQFIDGPLGRFAFGSMPGVEEGNINIQDAMEEGYTTTAHESYDPYLHMALFDTANPAQCPPHRREEVEAFLLGHYELGRSYVRVDNYNLTPPWPTYPIEGDVDVEKFMRFVKAGGLAAVALQYEEAAANREELVEALRAQVTVELEQAQEDAGLSARV